MKLSIYQVTYYSQAGNGIRDQLVLTCASKTQARMAVLKLYPDARILKTQLLVEDILESRKWT